MNAEVFIDTNVLTAAAGGTDPVFRGAIRRCAAPRPNGDAAPKSDRRAGRRLRPVQRYRDCTAHRPRRATRRRQAANGATAPNAGSDYLGRNQHLTAGGHVEHELVRHERSRVQRVQDPIRLGIGEQRREPLLGRLAQEEVVERRVRRIRRRGGDRRGSDRRGSDRRGGSLRLRGPHVRPMFLLPQPFLACLLLLLLVAFAPFHDSCHSQSVAGMKLSWKSFQARSCSRYGFIPGNGDGMTLLLAP